MTIMPAGKEPPRPAAPLTVFAATGQGGDFASLLAAGRGSASDLLRGGTGDAGALPLRDRLAAVFNEFGFFRALDADVQQQPRPGEESEGPSPGMPVEPLAPPPQAIHSADGNAMQPAKSLPRGEAPPAALRVPEGAAGLLVDRAAPSHIIAGGPPTGPGRERPAPIDELPRLPLAKSGTDRPSPFAAHRQAPRVGEDGYGDATASRPGASAKGARPPERGDRIAFRIGEHLVELIARIEGLSAEEEKKLMDALDELLSLHGMALSGATINGRPFAMALLGGRG